MAIAVEHLARTYSSDTGSLTAVADLSFAVRGGEIVGLIGPNGAGKTTTLRALAGILRPTSGRVFIDGHDIVADPLEAKRRLAFMPDEPHLFEYLTVTEHLRLVARLFAVADIDRRSAALLEELELRGKERSLPGELSRGMRQMRETIVARGRAGAAILLSSHLLHLVEEICTRVIIMDRGQKIADGTFEELRSRVDLAEAGSNLEQIFLSVTGNNRAGQP